MSSILTGASNVAISGGTFVNNTYLGNSALERLSAAAAHSALHDAPARTDETRCHQHTRTNVLDHLERWAKGIFDEDTAVFWLHGGAGAGKSAIMQTLAERCAAQRLALGSFFFSRSDPTRNTAEVLIPTLAYQLAQLFPAALEILDPNILRDPLIFKKALPVQLLNLLVQPLDRLVQLGSIGNTPGSPSVFLIDGLDECADTAQQQLVIQMTATLCHEHHIPVKFLIASRSEHVISTSFERYKRSHLLLGTISLSEDPDAGTDIRRFIEDEFRQIRNHHGFKNMIPFEWPARYDANRLVWKSSSHFIYASTAIKYIWSTKESPVRSLQVVLGLEVSRTISPFSELDALYHHILDSAAHRDKVLQVLAHCVYTRLPPSSSIVCSILDCSEDDLCIYLVDVAPLLALSKPTGYRVLKDKIEVKLLHASLRDFLSHPSRSGSLHIKEDVYLASTLEQHFRLLDTFTRKPNQEQHELARMYDILENQIRTTIRLSGHLALTQEVLGRYRLLDLYLWRLRLTTAKNTQILYDMYQFFLAISSIVSILRILAFHGTIRNIERLVQKTAEGSKLVKSSVDDFLNILHNHIRKTVPLSAAVLTLLFMGYPHETLRPDSSLFLQSNDSLAIRLMKHFLYFWDLPMLDPASFDQHLNPHKRLLLAAEIVLEYVFREDVEHCYWRHLRGNSQSLPLNVITVSELLDILQWVLPKARISETVAHYSKRTFPQAMLLYEGARVSLVKKSLAEYTGRVQDIKLRRLDQKIEIGNFDALIEKSRMLLINNQD